MKLSVLIILLFAMNSQAENILVIGDSHTAGPFGNSIKKYLQIDHNIAVYGHSSSASVNWMEEKVSFFTGGIYHAANINKTNLINPRPIPWRQKAATPKYKNFMSNMLYHPEWKNKFKKVKADIAVIALGANDSRAISDEYGNPRNAYQMRQEAIKDMLKLVRENNMKCIWIGPPGSVMKFEARQNTLYKYLEEAVLSQCEFFSSRHFVAKKWKPNCDGVHFSCNREGFKIADIWAKEVADFINVRIN